MCPRWAYDTYFDLEKGLCTTCLEESEKALTPAEAESRGLQFCSVPTSSAYPYGRSDWLCSSVADDCCACDKSIGQLTCGFDEPATCHDGYVAMIPPGADYDGSCEYSCYPPGHDHGTHCGTYLGECCSAAETPAPLAETTVSVCFRADDSKCSSIADDCCAPGSEEATCSDGYVPVRTFAPCDRY